MGIRIDRRTLPDYATADFWEAMQMWKDWHVFGNPSAGGSNDQSAVWVEVVRNMEEFSKRFPNG